MKKLKFTIDIEGNSVRTEGFEKDGNITSDEAGLSHTDLSDKDEIVDYFQDRYPDDSVSVEFE